MNDAQCIVLSGGLWSRLVQGELITVVLVGVGLGAMVALLFALLLLSRRRFRADLREVVGALEKMRSGRSPEMVSVDPASPLAMVFDALNRLGQDVSARVRAADEERLRLSTMTEAVQDSAVVTTDADGDIRSMTRGAEELFGWSEADLLSQSAALLFEEASYKEFLPKLMRRSLRESGIDTRAEMRRQDAAVFTARLTVRMMRDGVGGHTGFVLRVHDVTETARLERRLAEAEARFQSFVEGVGEGVLIVREGHVLYSNDSAAAMVEGSTEQLRSTRLRDLIATRDVLMVEDRLGGLKSSDGTVELDCSLQRRGGSPLQVHVQASSIHYESHPSVLLLLRDVSLERRVEAELRRNEARLDGILEAVSDGILLLVSGPGGGNVQMVNQAFLQLFGLEQRQVLGRSELQLRALLAEAGGPARELATFLSATPAASADPACRTLLDADQEWPESLEVHSVPLRRGESGEVQGRVVACRDLREQRRNEHDLQTHAEQLQLSKVMLEQAYRRLEKMNREQRSRAEELDQLNRELRKLDEMKNNLLGNVSHELQTPLVSIRGYTEMMLKQRLGTITDEQRKGLRLCLQNIDRLISMIDNLLVLHREQASGPIRLELQRFRLDELVGGVCELLEDKIDERSIRLERQVSESLLVHGDRDRIQQVFINLLSNAVKFNRDGGSIVVSASAEEDRFIDVVVRDTGQGIPAEALPKIFDRHYQVDGVGDDKPRGSGIGLAIVRDILESHGCRIEAQSEPGRGTRFRFTLPAAGPLKTDRRDPSPADESPPEEHTGDADLPTADSGEPETDAGLQASPPPTDAPEDRSIGELVDEVFGDVTLPSSEAGDDDEPPPRFRVIRQPADER